MSDACENDQNSLERIQAYLDITLEAEFSFLPTEQLAQMLFEMADERQTFVLQWTRRVAATNVQLAFEFASRAGPALQAHDETAIEAWCLHAMDCYDRSGLHPAMAAIQDLEHFLASGQRHAAASKFEDAVPVLFPFVHGLSGRALKIERDAVAWTDGETLFLPEMMARFDDEVANFQLYKAIVAHLWAQMRFGTLNVNLVGVFAGYADAARAQAVFHALETSRLDARIARELPGLARHMATLRGQAGDEMAAPVWREAIQALGDRHAGVVDTLAWLPRVYEAPVPEPVCYQGEMRPELSWAARERRLLRDKARFRESLRVVAEEIAKGRDDAQMPESFGLEEPDEPIEDMALGQLEVTLSDQPIAMPEQVRDLMRSIQLDLDGIPPEYLTPAGPGEYDPGLLQDEAASADDAWAGTYHEEGASLYNEWDFARQAYKKSWCVLREIEVSGADLDFYRQTLKKHASLLHSLRRTFEVLRGEDRLLKRQRFGDDVDLDALVEAWGDAHAGHEMDENLFTRMHKDERNIAVIFMVDMSGSTRGWINDAEREALILLAESLESLGDRYAIYGFSGWTRKRCEVFRIKDFDTPWDEYSIGRVCGIEPKDYTRMGAPIRHLIAKLEQVEARTKLLITLSDGKPDDYDLEYRGEYGIEDTRQALFEARVAGVHPFCITIDEEGADYLPHMYGAANYVVLDEVRKLPLKVADIYRKLTS